MKIAIPHWQGRVSPVFDVSDGLLLIDVKDGGEVRREGMVLVHSDPFARAKEVADLGTKALLCGAVSHVLERALVGAGVEVFGFICGDLEAVLEAFLRGQLDDDRFLMPGSCARRRRRKH